MTGRFVCGIVYKVMLAYEKEYDIARYLHLTRTCVSNIGRNVHIKILRGYLTVI